MSSQMTVRSLRAWCAAVERQHGPDVPVWLLYPVALPQAVDAAPLRTGITETQLDGSRVVILSAYIPVQEES